MFLSPILNIRVINLSSCILYLLDVLLYIGNVTFVRCEQNSKPLNMQVRVLRSHACPLLQVFSPHLEIGWKYTQDIHYNCLQHFCIDTHFKLTSYQTQLTGYSIYCLSLLTNL